MFSTLRTTAIGAAALALSQLASPAQAAYVLTMLEVPAGGGITNVVATGSGSLDITDLHQVDAGLSRSSTAASSAFILVGPTNPGVISSEGPISGPSNFGSGNEFSASSGSGNLTGVCGNSGCAGGFQIDVPSGYISGSPLSGNATWNSATFTSLGEKPGTYEWTWGTGAHADSFTLRIGAVPEPGSLMLLAVGLAGLGVVLRTRRA
jgi:hypothetical protein